MPNGTGRGQETRAALAAKTTHLGVTHLAPPFILLNRPISQQIMTLSVLLIWATSLKSMFNPMVKPRLKKMTEFSSTTSPNGLVAKLKQGF